MFAWRRHDPKVTAEVLARLMRRLQTSGSSEQASVKSSENLEPRQSGWAAVLPFRSARRP